MCERFEERVYCSYRFLYIGIYQLRTKMLEDATLHIHRTARLSRKLIPHSFNRRRQAEWNALELALFAGINHVTSQIARTWYHREIQLTLRWRLQPMQLIIFIQEIHYGAEIRRMACEEKGEEETKVKLDFLRSLFNSRGARYTVHLRISPNCSKIPLFLFASRRGAWKRRRRLRIPDYFLLARNWESRVTVSELLEAFITRNCFEEIARLVTWHIRITFRTYCMLLSGEAHFLTSAL